MKLTENIPKYIQPKFKAKIFIFSIKKNSSDDEKKIPRLFPRINCKNYFFLFEWRMNEDCVANFLIIRGASENVNVKKPIV